MAIPSTTREYFLPKVGSFDNLTLHTKNVNQPKGNEVLVKVHAVSLQYRDLIIATGRFPTGGPLDVVPCSDMAGEIVTIGPDVKNWKTGDRICANFASDFIFGPFTPSMQKTALGGPTHGVLTEYRTFPAHSLVAIPEHLSYEEASTLPCAAVTAYNALLGSIPVKAGDYVLILGTGGVSIFGLQIAVASGAEVIATSSSDEKLKIAKKLGATHVINYKTTPNWDEEVLKITNGVGVNHVLEVGGQGTLLKSIKSSTIGGYVHLIGWVSKDVNSGAEIVIPAIFHGATLRPVMAGSLSQFLDLNRLLCANPDQTRPVIDKVFSFEEAKHAYEYLASQAHVGKVVIKVSKD